MVACAGRARTGEAIGGIESVCEGASGFGKKPSISSPPVSGSGPGEEWQDSGDVLGLEGKPAASLRAEGGSVW